MPSLQHQANDLVAWRHDGLNDAGQSLRLAQFPTTGLASASPFSTIGLSGTWLEAPPVRSVLLALSLFESQAPASTLTQMFHDDYCMGPGSVQCLQGPDALEVTWTQADLHMHCNGRRCHVSQLDQATLDSGRLQAGSPALATLLAAGRPLRSNLCRLRVGQRYRLAILPSDAVGKVIDALALALHQARPNWRPALYPARGTVRALPQVAGQLTLLVQQAPDEARAAQRLSALQASLPNVDIDVHSLRSGSETCGQALARSANDLAALSASDRWALQR